MYRELSWDEKISLSDLTATNEIFNVVLGAFWWKKRTQTKYRIKHKEHYKKQTTRPPSPNTWTETNWALCWTLEIISHLVDI